MRDPHVRAPMGEFRTAVVGAAIVVLGPLSFSLYTPALPALVEAFGTSAAAVKLTLTVYFAGFAFAQLVCGPLTDAFGRRPVAQAFFGIYLVGSLACAFSPTLEWLLAGRTLQGIGAAAGIAVSRAMVRDQFAGQKSARIMNLIGIMLAVGPAIAPTLGGVILTAIGWHAIFLVMVAYGLVVIALMTFVVPETNRHIDRALVRPSRVLSSYRELLSNSGFLGTALLMAMSPGALYTFAAMLPFVLIERVGLTPTQFGMGMLAQTGSYLMGAMTAGMLLRRMDAHRLVPMGLTLVVISGIGFGVGLRIWPASFVTVMGPVALWAFGNALIMPGTTASALAPFPHIAGAASALTGFTQIGGGLVGTAVAALLFSDPFVALTSITPVMAILAVIFYFTLARRAFRDHLPMPEPEDIEVAVDPAGIVGAAAAEIESAAVRLHPTPHDLHPHHPHPERPHHADPRRRGRG